MLSLPRPVIEADRENTVTIRLSAESTATIWLKSAEIRLVE